MKKVMIVNGYVWILVLPFMVIRYLKTGEIDSKWGVLSGDSASWALLGYSLLTIVFGTYSISETKKAFRDK